MEFVRRFNPRAAEVYEDRDLYELTFDEISTLRDISKSESRALYRKAKQILKEGEKAWLLSLSNRTRKALIANDYASYRKLFDDINDAKIDLESLPKIGHKVAEEIRRYCACNKPKRRKEDV